MTAQSGQPYFAGPYTETPTNGHGVSGQEPGADDPTALPLFATDPGPRPGRERGDFTLRPLVPAPQTAPRHAADPSNRRESTDWELVAELRGEASDLLTARLEKEGGTVTDRDREILGREIISELLHSRTTENVSAGRHGWTATERDQLQRALFDALFRLGRLQPLVDDDRLENIFIIARGENCLVWLEDGDGLLVPGDPVVESEEELREFLADLGSRQNRPFSEARPSLHLRLPGGHRLAAASWVTAATSVGIRRHRIIEVSIEEMVQDKGACGAVAANFLTACVKAGKSIVVSGVQGSGKTTWVRALCSSIPPWEKIGTFETEFELHLHELTERHPLVFAWEHRPGSGEVGINGRQAGEFTLQEAIHDSFRFTLDRQIVGEVRGPEVWNMLKAMESGPGSISTTHARSAEHTIEKLVSCAMEMGPQVTRELAVTKLSAAVDVVMHLHVEIVPNGDGTFRKNRWLQEVMVIDPSHDAAKGYEATPVFKAGADGHAVATGHLPDRLREDLVRFGFDLNAYKAEADTYAGGVVL